MLNSFTVFIVCSQEEKYGKCAVDEADWLDLKLDILFQVRPLD